jgi:hypothetical protein
MKPEDRAAREQAAREFVRGVLVDCFNQPTDEETINRVAQKVLDACLFDETPP